MLWKEDLLDYMETLVANALFLLYLMIVEAIGNGFLLEFTTNGKGGQEEYYERTC